MKKGNFLFLIVLVIFFCTYTSANAQKITPSLTATKESTPSVYIKYDLAFPGILPDHPLYKLKVLRDKISLSLISDPLKKIDFYVLQADKGILATAMLVGQNKIELAKSTALKAEHNFTLLSSTYKSYYYKQEGDIPNKENLLKKLRTASLKHQEVLNSLLKKVPKDNQKTFLQVIDFSKRNISKIENIKKEYEADKKSEVKFK